MDFRKLRRQAPPEWGQPNVDDPHPALICWEHWDLAGRPIFALEPAVLVGLCFTEPLSWTHNESFPLPYDCLWIDLPEGMLFWSNPHEGIDPDPLLRRTHKIEIMGFYLSRRRDMEVLDHSELDKDAYCRDSEELRARHPSSVSTFCEGCGVDHWSAQPDPEYVEAMDALWEKHGGRRVIYSEGVKILTVMRHLDKSGKIVEIPTEEGSNDHFWHTRLLTRDRRSLLGYSTSSRSLHPGLDLDPSASDLPPHIVSRDRLVLNLITAFNRTRHLQTREVRPPVLGPKKTKIAERRGRSFAAYNTVHIDTDKLERVERRSRATGGTGRTPKTHLRMGHFNHYWVKEPKDTDVPDATKPGATGILYRVTRLLPPTIVHGVGPLDDVNVLVKRYFG